MQRVRLKAERRSDSYLGRRYLAPMAVAKPTPKSDVALIALVMLGVPICGLIFTAMVCAGFKATGSLDHNPETPYAVARVVVGVAGIVCLWLAILALPEVFQWWTDNKASSGFAFFIGAALLVGGFLANGLLGQFGFIVPGAVEVWWLWTWGGVALLSILISKR